MGNGMEGNLKGISSLKSPHYEFFCEVTITVPGWNFKRSFAMLVGFDTVILIVILSAVIMVLAKVGRWKPHSLTSIDYFFSLRYSRESAPVGVVLVVVCLVLGIVPSDVLSYPASSRVAFPTLLHTGLWEFAQIGKVELYAVFSGEMAQL